MRKILLGSGPQQGADDDRSHHQGEDSGDDESSGSWIHDCDGTRPLRSMSMHRLRLFAININDVRDIFGADPLLAARLRGVAARNFTPAAPERSLLQKIGPLFSRHRSTEVDSNNPLSTDVEAMLSGGHIPVERLPQCWQLLLTWLEELAAQHQCVTLDDLEDTEFELARAGLPSTCSLRSLASRELGIAPRPPHDQLVGYSKHPHVLQVSRELRRILGDAGEGLGKRISSVLPLLSLAEGIAQRPAQALDLVVIEVSEVR